MCNFLCKQTSMVIFLWALTISTAFGERPSDIPETLSQLMEKKEIIDGLIINDGYCKLKIKKSYGLNSDEQFNYLLRLIRYSAWIDVDRDCGMKIRIDTLNHLLDLAIKNKSSKARRVMILNYSELALDGEVAEFYVETHMIKVLMSLENISAILSTNKEMKQVAEDLCLGWRNPNGILELEPLIAKLQNNESSGKLILIIQETCPEAFPK